MKHLTHTLLTAAIFCAGALFAKADPAPKIVIVDMEKIFNNHYSTVSENAKLKADSDKAQQRLDQMLKERDTLVTQYKDLASGAENPTATADAKQKAATDAQKKGQEVQAKTNDINNFANNVKADIQKRIQDFRSMMMDEISKVVITVAKRHDASLVLDKSGPTLLGIAPVIYADPSYDLTDEVIAEINKTKPAGTPEAPSTATTPAPSSESAPSSAPMFTVPNTK
jgi:outer membrane protein